MRYLNHLLDDGLVRGLSSTGADEAPGGRSRRLRQWSWHGVAILVSVTDGDPFLQNPGGCVPGLRRVTARTGSRSPAVTAMPIRLPGDGSGHR